jgi:hypothetical protein
MKAVEHLRSVMIHANEVTEANLMANIPLLYWRNGKRAEPLTASPFL